MFPILHLGPLAIQTSGLFLLIGFWAGLVIAEQHAPRYGVTGNQIYTLGLVAFISGVVGARLVYIAQYPSIFQANPLNVIALSIQMLDPLGGYASSLVVSLIYLQRKRIPFWMAVDAGTSCLGILWIAIGLSHLATGDAFGAPSQTPWSIWLWGQARQPSQVYEILSSLLVLGLTWPRNRGSFVLTGGISVPSGVRFMTFLVLVSFSRLFLEAFRGDSVFILGQVRSAMLVAWVVMASSLFVIGYRLRSSRLTPQPREETHA